MGCVRTRLTAWSAVLLAVLSSAGAAFSASPTLVVDVDTGQVLYQNDATAPWFPASTTKLMSVYVALSAVREGRITLDTPLMVSPRAASMAPSKMGFRPGTLVTLDNALKMLMVKSPNDVAVTIAEGVSGSVENFANDMNVYAARLGLHESHFANPNGLPDPSHVSSARDMALIARALLRDYPEERGLFGIGVLAFGRQLINNHNGLLGRYPGVDGMKTGFTCSAGYNIVASAERNGHHLITVVMGAPSNGERNGRVAALFDRFFANGGGGVGSLDSLPASAITAPPDNRPVICGGRRGAAVAEAENEDSQITGGTATSLSPTRTAFEPVRVFVGPVPGWTGRVAQARDVGARELNPAPGTPTIQNQRMASTASDTGGAVESAAPGPGSAPMALLGAAPLSPAAAATGSLVRASPGLGLKVSGRRGRVARGHAIAPVKAALARPSLLATTEAVATEKAVKGPHATKALHAIKGGKPAAQASVAKPAASKPAPKKPAAKAKTAAAK